MGALTITVDDRQVKKTLTSLNKQLGNMQKPLDDAGSDLLQYYGEEVFDTEGSALGVKWKPLSAATLKARRERRGYYAQTPVATNKILTWTARLRKGFKKKATRDRLVVSNSVDYFKYHQLGGRRMLGVNKNVVVIVLKRLQDAINKSIV